MVRGGRNSKAARGKERRVAGKDVNRHDGHDARKDPSRGAWARTREWVLRAKGTSGTERQTLELIVKSTAAASASWFVAHDLMAATAPAFAPFSAVLIMQVTVYQSLVQALRHLAAVAAGVFVQAGLGFLAGPDLLTFAVVTLIALVIGRWRRLGPQGVQVSTAAFFAFSTYAASTENLRRVEQLGQIVLLVGIGCGIGLLVNLAVLPPIRYRSAEKGIRTLAGSLYGLLGDMHPVLRAGDLTEEQAGAWRQRATHLGDTVSHSRSALRTAWESGYYNPRRHLPGNSRDADFSLYQEVLDALDRVTHQVASMARTLHHWPQDEDGEESRRFLRDYADLLEALADVTRHFGEIDGKSLHRQATAACECADRAQEKRRLLVERTRDSALSLSDPSRPYAILLAEATRLMDEAQHSCDVLRHGVDEAHRTPGDARTPAR